LSASTLHEFFVVAHIRPRLAGKTAPSGRRALHERRHADTRVVGKRGKPARCGFAWRALASAFSTKVPVRFIGIAHRGSPCGTTFHSERREQRFELTELPGLEEASTSFFTHPF